MDGGAWWAAVHGAAKSWAGLSDFTFTLHFPALEKAMATHSSVFAWRIPGTGEPGGLPSMGSHRVGHDWSDLVAAAAAAGKSRWVVYAVFPGLSPPPPHPLPSVLIKIVVNSGGCRGFLSSWLSELEASHGGLLPLVVLLPRCLHANTLENSHLVYHFAFRKRFLLVKSFLYVNILQKQDSSKMSILTSIKAWNILRVT